MFKNIGQKIKTLANVLCWMGIIFSIIMGVFSLSEDISIALLYLIVCPILSWVGSFVLYGFGELVENSEKTAMHLKYLADAERKRENREKDRDSIASEERAKGFSSNVNLIKCSYCRNVVDLAKLEENGMCPWCGSKIR